ncbi:MAG TPA: DUF3015 family protein [Nitrospira sp.]
MRQNCIVREVFSCLVIAGLGLSLTACNTTKATMDTTVNFFSSTSPGSMFTADGMVEQKQKVNLFAGVAFENLRQDMAQGGGPYLTSLAVLMNIPSDRQDEFARFVQDRYPVLFTSDLATDHTAHLKMLAVLDRELETYERAR